MRNIYIHIPFCAQQCSYCNFRKKVSVDKKVHKEYFESLKKEIIKSPNIKDGDFVKIYNDRGKMIVPVRVTERIMPGVADLPQGAWYDPDVDGVDLGGCANILTNDVISPGGAFPSNTTLVQIEKI